MLQKHIVVPAVRILAGLCLLAAAASAPATIIVTFNAATTTTHVDYTISGSYDDLATGLAFTSGPWTITLDSPVPIPEPGSGNPWSLRLVLTYSGLTGGRTDYFGGDPGVTIQTFSPFHYSGTFAAASAGFIYASLSVANPDLWFVGGADGVDLSRIPEPTSIALLGLGLAAAAGVARRRRTS